MIVDDRYGIGDPRRYTVEMDKLIKSNKEQQKQLKNNTKTIYNSVKIVYNINVS